MDKLDLEGLKREAAKDTLFCAVSHAEMAAILAALERISEPADKREQGWRTGRHPADEPGPRQKTIYGPDGELRGVMFTTEDARLVVDALNALAQEDE